MSPIFLIKTQLKTMFCFHWLGWLAGWAVRQAGLAGWVAGLDWLAGLPCRAGWAGWLG